MTFNETLSILSSEFEKLVQTKTVIGEPFAVGDVTLVPVVSVTCGIGGGGGEGNAGTQANNAGGTGVGIGGGFRVTPIGVVVVKGDDVSLLTIKKKGGFLDKLFEALPQLADKIKMGHGKDEEPEADEAEDSE